jgi:hypothetical protein
LDKAGCDKADEFPPSHPPEEEAKKEAPGASEVGGLKNKPPEVSKTNPNYTELSETECECFFDRCIDRCVDTNIIIDSITNQVRNQIDYDALLKDALGNKKNSKRLQQHFADELDEIVENIVEVYIMSDSSDDINIGGKSFPVAYVKHRYSKLNYESVSYMRSCLNKTKKPIYNIKKYLTAAMFNACTTGEHYVQAEVNHDLAYGLEGYRKKYA